MNEILAMVRKKQIDVIIIHNLDRLTRQVRDLATLLELFDQNDVSLISITEKIDTKTPMGRFFIFLIVLIAQWEQETISSRTIRGIEESARQGNYASPGNPFGYRRNPEDNHKLIIEENEAAVVKRIFESVAYKDYSIKSIVNEFNCEQLAGRRWSEQLVLRILENKLYYGTFTRFGVEYPNHTMPIIDQSMYDLAQLRLKGNIRLNRRDYIYKGLVVCKQCGSKMSNHSGKSQNGSIHNYYQCKKCGRKQVSENAITERFSGEFDILLRQSRIQADISRLKSQYTEIVDIIEKIPLSLYTSCMDIEYSVNFYACSEEEKTRLSRFLRTIKAGINSTSFTRLSFSQQRDFLLANVAQITYDIGKKRLEIFYTDKDAEIEEDDQ